MDRAAGGAALFVKAPQSDREPRQFPLHRALEISMTSLRSLLPVLAAAAALAVPVAAPAQITPPTPDVFTSANVQYLGAFKLAGDGTGARIVGDTLFATSSLGLFIFDIKDPENPQLLGSYNVAVHFENEDVPTNGKILGISDSTVGQACGPGEQGGGCLLLYDVTTPAAPRLIKAVTGISAHTAECVFDCTWFYGSEGQIVDARNPADAKVVEELWTTAAQDQGYDVAAVPASPHDVTEVAPGYVVTASQPFVMFSLHAKDGGSPQHPVVIASGTNEDQRFIHSIRWPNEGRDRFMLVGGETVLSTAAGLPVGNGGGPCNDEASAFMTWNADKVRNIATGGYNTGSTWSLVDEVRPFNGTYADGGHPYDGFGCSVHWFEAHPTFRNGGVVAVSEYEHGTRIYQVSPEGKITEQGFALPVGGAASAPYWARNGKVFYTMDYQRGLEIWRYTGDTYVPADDGTLTPTPGATPGTGGQSTVDAPPCASAAGFRSATAKGSGKGVAFVTQLREQRPFTVEVFQQSAGRKIVKERLVARFTNKKAGFTWNGKDRKGRKLANGNYFVRFTMKLSSGLKDIRRATLSRSGGRFKIAPDFYQRVDCGVFRSLKLSSSVFGGTSSEPLGIAYKLEEEARSVKIQVKVGSKIVKTFTGGGTKGKTYRFSLKSSAVKKGKTVDVLVAADRGTPATAIKLTAKRL